MAWEQYSQLIKEGLWSNNQAFVALLGLCPLLAVSNTLINSLGLGVATTITLVCSNVVVAMVRKMIPNAIRLPVFVLIIASIVTVIELMMKAYFFELYKVLGIFIPLIVTNCAIIGRAESFAFRNSPYKAFWDGLFMGLGFTVVLVILGSVREILGIGTLLSGAELMFGPSAESWTIFLFEDYSGMLLAILPPGAFISLGLLIALRNTIDIQFKMQRNEVNVKLADKMN